MRERERLLLVSLVWVHLVVGGTVFWHAPEPGADSWDPRKFYDLVQLDGRPYRDRPAEYPPGALLMFGALRGGDGYRTFLQRLILLQVAADLGIAALMAWGWSRRASLWYLALSAPFLFRVLTIPVLVLYDLTTVALAVAAWVLVRRGKQVASGMLLAVSVFLKVFTVFLVPAFIARRQWRALAASLVTGTVAGTAWLAYGGLEGVGQVLTFRGARGWHIESGSGVVVRLFDREPLRLESGAFRFGEAPATVRIALAVLLVVIVGAAWSLARRYTSVDGVAESTVVAAVLVLSPLFSPQFFVWLIPWVALTGAAGQRRVAAWGVAAAALTLAAEVRLSTNEMDAVRAQVCLFARNAALAGLVIAGLRRLAQGADPVG